MQVMVSARNMVWCLTMLPSIVGPLTQVEDSLQGEGDEGSLTNKVDCGDFVASRSPEDKRWYRACVTKKTASGTHMPAATVRVLTSDPMSFRVGQLLSFVVESVDGGEVRGTVTSEDDGKEMGTCALAPWNSGLDAGEPVASPSPAKAAAAPAAPPSASPRSQPLPSQQVDAKVLHVPQRKLPTSKCPMIPVWKTTEVLYLHQQSLASDLQAMMVALNGLGEDEDATWYRGQVVTEKLPDDKYLVLFIDFGNNEQLPVSSLRPLPPRFAEAPLFAFSVVPENACRLFALSAKDGTCLNDLIRGVRPKECASLAADGLADQADPQKAPDETSSPTYIAECPVPKSPFNAVVCYVEGNLVYVQPLNRCASLLKISQRTSSGTVPRVISTDEAACTVRVKFVDYGNTENMTAKCACAFARANDFLPKEPLVVELVNNSTPPLARLTHNGKCINAVAAPRDAPLAPKKAFAERPLPVGRTKAVITYVTDPGRLIYLQQSSLIPELQSMMLEINGSVPDTPVTSPVLGDAVCARYAADGLWYRAAVVSLPQDDKCKVSFVDFGNDDFVPVGDIRPLADQFKTIPLIANCVALQGVKSQLMPERVSFLFFTTLATSPPFTACQNHVLKALHSPGTIQIDYPLSKDVRCCRHHCHPLLPDRSYGSLLKKASIMRKRADHYMDKGFSFNSHLE
ncbi:hypothetical protein MRX96_023207 [Rhipicephalus microplus]